LRRDVVGIRGGWERGSREERVREGGEREVGKGRKVCNRDKNW